MISDKRLAIIDKIKQVSDEIVHYPGSLPGGKISVFISERLDYDYTYLANTFSSYTGTSIRHYILYRKIELVKHLLVYSNLNLTQIAQRLHYSSVAHLSNQFKRVTGTSPSVFLNSYSQPINE